MRKIKQFFDCIDYILIRLVLVWARGLGGSYSAHTTLAMGQVKKAYQSSIVAR